MKVKTLTGEFDIANPISRDVRIDDLTVSLCRMHRYNAQSHHEWTVGDHMLLCYDLCTRAGHDHETSLAVMLHDAHEAYVGDIVTPLKNVLNAHGFNEIVARIDRAIYTRFGLMEKFSEGPTKKLIREIDEEALSLELDHLFKCEPLPYWMKRSDRIEHLESLLKNIDWQAGK